MDIHTYVVRITATDEQYKALRTLAIERGQTVQAIVTAALQTAPVTRKVFA